MFNSLIKYVKELLVTYPRRLNYNYNFCVIACLQSAYFCQFSNVKNLSPMNTKQNHISNNIKNKKDVKLMPINKEKVILTSEQVNQRVKKLSERSYMNVSQHELIMAGKFFEAVDFVILKELAKSLQVKGIIKKGNKSFTTLYGITYSILNLDMYENTNTVEQFALLKRVSNLMRFHILISFIKTLILHVSISILSNLYLIKVVTLLLLNTFLLLNFTIVWAEETYQPFPFDTWSSAYTIDNPDYATRHMQTPIKDPEPEPEKDSGNKTCENPFSIYSLPVNNGYIAHIIVSLEEEPTMSSLELYDLIPNFTVDEFYLTPLAKNSIKNLEYLLELKVNDVLLEILVLLKSNLYGAELIADNDYTEEHLSQLYRDNMARVMDAEFEKYKNIKQK